VERIEKLKSFIAADPSDLFSRHALAMEWVKLGDFPAAIEQMEAILQIDDQHLGTYYHLGKPMKKYPYSKTQLWFMKRVFNWPSSCRNNMNSEN
jgi:hypothetical protein